MAGPSGILEMVRVDNVDQRGEKAVSKRREDTQRFAGDPGRGGGRRFGVHVGE
jgi:hypothetical protein